MLSASAWSMESRAELPNVPRSKIGARTCHIYLFFDFRFLSVFIYVFCLIPTDVKQACCNLPGAMALMLILSA